MKFPNLLGGMAARGRKHYEVALAVGMTESTFSRCVRGLRDFSPEQRRKIAAFLGYPEPWLFKGVKRPRGQPSEEKTGGRVE